MLLGEEMLGAEAEQNAESLGLASLAAMLLSWQVLQVALVGEDSQLKLTPWHGVRKIPFLVKKK